MRTEQLRDFMNERPFLAVAVAGALGIVLGGVLFRRLGRLLFIASVGYVANELCHREGRLGIDNVIDRLSR